MPPLDLDAYRRDGFLVCRFPLFDPPTLAALEAIADEYRRDAEAGRRDADLNVPHFADPRLFAFLMAERVLDLVAPITGPDIALWTSQFFCKAPGTGRAIGWHADAHYWQGYLEPIEVASVWLALDRADRANGCLQVVRGSHRRRDFRYVPRADGDDAFFPAAIPAADIDAAAVVPIELERGEFVLFDGWLVHGSEANRGTRRRCGFTLRYMPTTCRFHPHGRRGLAAVAARALAPALGALRGRPVYEHRIYLARGRDCAGNRYADWPRGASVRRSPSSSDTPGA